MSIDHDDTKLAATARKELADTAVMASGEAARMVDALAEPAVTLGTSIGRYVVLAMLGEGAMGVVWAAYDPELDRKVAIKLLRNTSDPKRRKSRKARLAREAQAIAKLNHPNVVSVYDVGTHEGQLFITMEYAGGGTLEGWLEDKRARDWRSILARFVATGRGLAAAHAAGVVHRDFKPSNVLLGEDGRPRVADFGLAQSDQERPPAALEFAIASASASSSFGSLAAGKLTKTGARMGTPAYMAPEQFQGAGVEAAADQFAFCVALYEALYEARPFAGTTYDELGNAVVKGELLEPPRSSPVPSSIQRVIARGLAVDPHERWSSMDALLGALSHDPTVTRQRVLGVVVLATVIAGLLGGSALLQRRAARALDLRCSAAAAASAAVWNEDARHELGLAFEASGASNAAALRDRTLPLLDQFVADWRHDRAAACYARATAEETERELVLAQQREACLDEQLGRMAVLVEDSATLAPAAAQVVIDAAYDLSVHRPCDDDAALQQRARAYADIDAEQLTEFQHSVTHIDSLLQLGDYDRAGQLAEQLRDQLIEQGPPALEAKARLTLGQVWQDQELAEPAIAELERAYARALESGADDVAVRAASSLVWIEGELNRDGAQAKLWLQLERASRVRAGLRELSPETLNEEGMLAARAGEFERALELLEQALERYEEQYCPGFIATAHVNSNIGIIYASMGEFERAATFQRRGLEVFEALYGRHHPRLVSPLNGLGGLLINLGQHDEAQALLERARELVSPDLGISTILRSVTLENLAMVYEAKCDYEEAEALFEQVITLRRTLPRDHPDLQVGLSNFGVLLVARGQTTRGIELLQEALAIDEARQVSAEELALNKIKLGLGYERAGSDDVRAQALYREGLEVFETGHPLRGWALVGLGRLALLREQPDEARGLLEEALAVSAEDDPVHRAEIEVALARALGPEDPRARSLAERARGRMRGKVDCAPALYEAAVELAGEVEP